MYSREIKMDAGESYLAMTQTQIARFSCCCHMQEYVESKNCQECAAGSLIGKSDPSSEGVFNHFLVEEIWLLMLNT